MNGILYSVFISLALRMSVITAIILIIKRVFKSKLSAKAQNAVWLIAAVQLVFCLCGVRIQTKSSVYNVIPQAARTAAALSPSGMTDARNIVTLIWLVGAVLLAVWYIAVFVSYLRKIRSFPVITDRETHMILSEVRAALGIDNERIELRSGDTAQTLMRLVILPAGYSQSETKQILLHELCHYKHRDSAKLCLALAALCLNWFNPLIWIAFRSFRTDIEMLCDDRVLKLTDSKKEYASVLVKSATVRSGFVPGAVSVHNGKNEVIRRVKRIVNLKKNKPVWLVVMMALSVTASCLCLTDAVTAAVEKKADIISSTPAPVVRETEKAPEPTAVPQTAENEETEPETKYDPEPEYVPERERDEEPQPAQAEDSSAQEYISEPEYTENTEIEGFSEPYEYEENDYSSSYVYTQTQTDHEDDGSLSDIEIGSDRSDVYSSMGEPDSVSSGGSKEEYALSDGSTAILQYDGDTLKQGYIVD